MRKVLALTAASSFALAANAQDHDHHAMKAASSGDAFIQVTINPEARVSAAVVGALPPPAACGVTIELPVKIVNQGFVTAALEVKLVDNVPPDVRVEFSPEPLQGTPEERRVLKVVILPKAAPADLTVAFRARNEIPDLGGRDRVHFLLRCE